jgi:hypothetical protein
VGAFTARHAFSAVPRSSPPGAIAMQDTTKTTGRGRRRHYGAIPLATVGGGVIAGAYFMTIGYLLTGDAIEHPTSQIPAPLRG